MVDTLNPSITVVNESKSTANALIEALPKLIWVGLLCCGLYLFHNQLGEMLSNINNREGASVEVAGIKITMPKSAVPAAPESIKNILPKLDDDIIQSIIGNPASNNRMNFCWGQQDVPELKETATLPKMIKLGLVSSLGSKVVIDGKDCVSGIQLLYNQTYYDTRTFLLSLIKGMNFNRS